MRIAIAAIALMGLVSSVAAEDFQIVPIGTPERASTYQSGHGDSANVLSWQEIVESVAGDVRLAQTCCKICRKGKACGDSCIAREKTCSKGPGCACDAN